MRIGDTVHIITQTTRPPDVCIFGQTRVVVGKIVKEPAAFVGSILLSQGYYSVAFEDRVHILNECNIFCTKEEADKELFIRRLCRGE